MIRPQHLYERWPSGQQRNKQIPSLPNCPCSQVAARAIFYFDCFSDYSLPILGEYSEKQSKNGNVFFYFLRIINEKPEKLTKSSYYSEKWSCARGPPKKSEPVANHIQISGGDKMDNTKLHEICVKKFSYVAWALPRYHVSLIPESDGKGVSA